jgi:hypothetical protein
MSGNGADGVLWAKIRHTAGCEDSAAEDAAVLEELEGAAQVRIAEELGEYAGLGRGPGWRSQPGWISEEESELDRIASFAIDPDAPGEGILWETFRELEQERFKVFVQGCAREWLVAAQEAERMVQEDEHGLAGVAQQDDVQGAGAHEEDRDPSEWRVVRVENLAPNVTVDILQGTFKQIGPVMNAAMGGEDWGWVEFELDGDAEEAVLRFGDVELAGQPMWCTLTHCG